jgi:hypothetical protein
VVALQQNNSWGLETFRLWNSFIRLSRGLQQSTSHQLKDGDVVYGVSKMKL